jgi:hypothetical protein
MSSSGEAITKIHNGKQKNEERRPAISNLPLLNIFLAASPDDDLIGRNI